MRIDSLELVKLLPEFLCDDVTAKAFAAALDSLLSDLGEKSARLTLWLADDLPESVLDSLAWQYAISWYDYSASAEVKRELVRNALSVQRILGTPEAVERVIADYLGGEARLAEWFDYGGAVYHYKIISSGAYIGDQSVRNRLYAALARVQNARSVLDGITWEWTASVAPSVAVGAHYSRIITMKQVKRSAPTAVYAACGEIRAGEEVI